jgi:hypothetical protein
MFPKLLLALMPGRWPNHRRAPLFKPYQPTTEDSSRLWMLELKFEHALLQAYREWEEAR